MGLLARILMICALACILQACETPQTQPQKTAAPDQESVAHVNDLLARANQAEPDEKLTLMLQAAEILAKKGDTHWARSIINNLPPKTNPDPAIQKQQFAQRALINSYIAATEGEYALALSFIDTQDLLANLPTLPVEHIVAVRRQRAQLLYDLENHTASISERVLLSELLSGDSPESEENQDQIWQTLMELPLEELQIAIAESPNRPTEGWYRLAALSKNNQTNLRQQLEKVDQWVRTWPEHPASLRLPADLQLLRQLVDEQPRQIAMLLPFSGKLASAANAIRDGFLASFYVFKLEEKDYPFIRFYDTNDVDINQIYDQAISDGAEVVIGPLAKHEILDLALRLEMPVPTLALNTIDSPLGPVPNLYQFGLGVEDEAVLAAEKAWRDGHRRALMIAPDSHWGDRSADTFAAHWRELGGDIVSDFRFEDTNDYAKVLKTALQLDQSEKRSAEIRRMLGSIEFEPRRRQDIDMIFLSAQASQARQVKPTLAFHYAGDIPVYGTSHVYSGSPQPKLDQDMNGVRFSTLPWFFAGDAPEKAAIARHSDSNPTLQPLYALGVDCFYVYPRLKQLEAVKQAQFHGQTGRLRLNDSRQVVRKQVWAEFIKGRPRQLAEQP